MENKLYDYKYHKKFSFFSYLKIVGIFNLVSLILVCSLNEKLGNLFFPIFFIAPFIIDIALLRMWFVKYSSCWEYRKFIQNRLDYLFDTNSMISKHIDTMNVKGKSQKITVLDYVPVVQYRKDDEKFYLIFQLDGSSISEKFYDLQEKLTNLFELDFEEKLLDVGKLTYIFSIVPDDRLVVNENTSFANFCNKDTIRITENISWNYRKIPHGLVTGGTGSGKTYFLLYLLKSVNFIGASIKLIDPKRSDLATLSEKLGEKNVACETNKILQLLRESVEEMNNRYDRMRSDSNNQFGHDFSDYHIKPMFILFDEVMSFMGSSDNKVSKEAMSYLVEIIAKGRQAGVFMILTSQRADTEFIKGSIRDQLGLRVALGKVSAEGYSMVFGNEYRDLKLTNYQKGDGFIHIDGMTAPRKFSSPFISNSDTILDDIM